MRMRMRVKQCDALRIIALTFPLTPFLSLYPCLVPAHSIPSSPPQKSLILILYHPINVNKLAVLFLPPLSPPLQKKKTKKKKKKKNRKKSWIWILWIFNKTESAIFASLMFPCFKRISIQNLFYLHCSWCCSVWRS